MKKKFIILMAALIMSALNTNAQNTWELITPTGDIPSARQGHSMVTIDSLVYLFGGQDGSKSILNILHSFDVALQDWNEETPFNTPPPARHGHKAIVRDGKMYVFFGKGTSTALDDIWQYNHVTREWTQITPSSTINPVARYDHSAYLLGNMVWIMGGLDNNGNPLSDLWAYNFTSNQWESYPDLTETALNGHVAAQNSGRLYLFSGYGGLYMNNIIYEFFPGSNSWAQHSPQGAVPDPFAYGSLVQYGESTAYIFTGETGAGNSMVKCYKWNLLTHNFTQLADGPDVAHAAAARCPNGNYDKTNYEKFVVFGGAADGTLVDSTWIYTSDIEIPAGLNVNEPANISVYPNPTSDFITISLSENDFVGKDLKYELCDIPGRTIKTAAIASPCETIDISDELPGIYFLNISDNEKTSAVFRIAKK